MTAKRPSEENVCRIGCGACCIAPSISSPIPGMPLGKPAGVRCAHLSVVGHCGLYGLAERPVVCGSYAASAEFCGTCAGEALRILSELEEKTGRGAPG